MIVQEISATNVKKTISLIMIVILVRFVVWLFVLNVTPMKVVNVKSVLMDFILTL